MSDSMQELLFHSSADTEQWAQDFARALKRPTLVLLDGEMGAGKTQLVKWMVAALGGAAVSSPTFAVHQSYEVTTGVVDHVDLYRLQSAADLESTGFWDLLRAPDALIFVEWAERVAVELWPGGIHRVHVKIARAGSQARRIITQLGSTT